MKGIRVTITLVAAVVALAFPAASTPASSSEVRADLDHYFAELERIHPDPYHSTSKADMRAAADRIVADAESLTEDQLLVRMMRFVALLGEREGHAGLFPFASHRRTLHAFSALDLPVPGRSVRRRHRGSSSGR